MIRGSRRRGDDGQVMLLILGFAVVCGLLVTVVVDASALFLQRRALSSAADGMALAGAQGIDEEAVYEGRASSFIPLDPELVDLRARNYLRTTDLASRFDAMGVERVASDGQRVEVELSARVRLPLVNLVTGSAEIELHATATAASAIGP